MSDQAGSGQNAFRGKLWFLEIDPATLWDFDETLLQDQTLGMLNDDELASAEFELGEEDNCQTSDDLVLPGGFLAPRLALARQGFAPDFFTLGGRRYCSRRFREALAQPEHIVQYAPVEIVDPGDEVRAQDYRLMRVIPRQRAMDIEKSDCVAEDGIDRVTGGPRKSVWFIDRFVFLDGFQPETEIFRVYESSHEILVADAVAERVLRAGCTGMEFTDPDCLFHGPRILRFRTADGVGERPVHMAG